MVLDLFKKKGKNLLFSIKLKPSISYPSQENRWKIYGEPLMRIFHEYFDEGAISWYKDNNGKLDLLVVICYGARFSYKKSEETNYTENLVKTLSHKVSRLFENFKTKATIIELSEALPKTLIEFTTIMTNNNKITEDISKHICYITKE